MGTTTVSENYSNLSIFFLHLNFFLVCSEIYRASQERNMTASIFLITIEINMKKNIKIRTLSAKQ